MRISAPKIEEEEWESVCVLWFWRVVGYYYDASEGFLSLYHLQCRFEAKFDATEDSIIPLQNPPKISFFPFIQILILYF